MTIAINANIAGRRLEDASTFGSHLFNVADLLKWSASTGKHLHVPVIEGQTFVQVELLLSAIEAQSMSEVSAADAMTLERHRSIDDGEPFRDQPELAHWRHGAKAHLLWRHAISKAVAAGELRLLDFASKLPIESPQTVPAAAAAAVPESEHWVLIARNYAQDELAERRARGLEPSLSDLGDHVAKRFRKEGIRGDKGSPSGATIKRRALTGLKDAKQR